MRAIFNFHKTKKKSIWLYFSPFRKVANRVINKVKMKVFENVIFTIYTLNIRYLQ